MITLDIPVDPRSDPVFLGRDEELRQVVSALRRGKHVLLTGEKGIGKSALMREALTSFAGISAPAGGQVAQAAAGVSEARAGAVARPGPSIVIQHASPLADCLKEIALQLWIAGALALPPALKVEADWEKVKKWFVQQGAAGRQDLICESLMSARPSRLVCFDSLDRITTTHQPFLERVLMSAVVCAAVVRPRETYHFKKIWSSFTCVELKPLPPDTARDLARRLIEGHQVKVTDPGLYEREVVKSSNGNPFHLRNLVWQGSCESSLGVDEIRSLRRIQEGEYFNMGPVYIFGASIFTLFKIFSLGMDNREFYIYFSALGFLVYLTFRVFRNFFLFRPQRGNR
jgi:energy-coupling factor transporter ATP-binding protein EcfA2